jgi:hypothetical protein
MNKIDLIIDALDQFITLDKHKWDFVSVEQALAAARELRDMKPVAYWNKAGYEFGADDEDFIYPETRHHHIKANSHADYWSIPLYALEQSE